MSVPMESVPRRLARLADSSGNPFHFSALIQKRARELAMGAVAFVGRHRSTSPIVVAMDEYERGLISLVPEDPPPRADVFRSVPVAEESGLEERASRAFRGA